MNVQVSACHSHTTSNVLNIFHSHCGPSTLCIAPPDIFILRTKSLKLTTDAPIYHGKILPKTYLRLKTGASSYQRWVPACLFGGKGKPENDNEVSPWKSLEKAAGNLKNEQSVEDALRQQIKKQEYYGDGGSGSGSGGGGGGGSGSGSGGSGDEDFRESLDEALQVILATTGLISLYLYLVLGGEEWKLVARDYIKFLFGAEKSNRLRRTMRWLTKFYQKWMIKELYKPHPLEREIVNTPTMWDDPIKYYGEDEDDPTRAFEYEINSLFKKEEEDEDDFWSNLEKDDDHSYLTSGDVDESSLKPREDGDSYFDSGEVDEPYLASKEEDEPYLASKEEDDPYLSSEEEDDPYLASEEEDELDLASNVVDEADLAWSEGDQSDEKVMTYLRSAESDEEDDINLDKNIDWELLEKYFAPRVKVVENNVEELDKPILVSGKEYKIVKVIVGDEEDDDVVEEEDENDYAGDNMEENDKDDFEGDILDLLDKFDELGEIERGRVIDSLNELEEIVEMEEDSEDDTDENDARSRGGRR